MLLFFSGLQKEQLWQLDELSGLSWCSGVQCDFCLGQQDCVFLPSCPFLRRQWQNEDESIVDAIRTKINVIAACLRTTPPFIFIIIHFLRKNKEFRKNFAEKECRHKEVAIYK